jgi:hypothetical protein
MAAQTINAAATIVKEPGMLFHRASLRATAAGLVGRCCSFAGCARDLGRRWEVGHRGGCCHSEDEEGGVPRGKLTNEADVIWAVNRLAVGTFTSLLEDRRLLEGAAPSRCCDTRATDTGCEAFVGCITFSEDEFPNIALIIHRSASDHMWSRPLNYRWTRFSSPEVKGASLAETATRVLGTATQARFGEHDMTRLVFGGTAYVGPPQGLPAK